MNEKIDTIIKYMQSKNTAFSVSEINEISQVLNSIKTEEVKVNQEVKPEVTPKKK